MFQPTGIFHNIEIWDSLQTNGGKSAGLQTHGGWISKVYLRPVHLQEICENAKLETGWSKKTPRSLTIYSLFTWWKLVHFPKTVFVFFLGGGSSQLSIFFQGGGDVLKLWELKSSETFHVLIRLIGLQEHHQATSYRSQLKGAGNLLVRNHRWSTWNWRPNSVQICSPVFGGPGPLDHIGAWRLSPHGFHFYHRHRNWCSPRRQSGSLDRNISIDRHANNNNVTWPRPTTMQPMQQDIPRLGGSHFAERLGLDRQSRPLPSVSWLFH